MSMKRVAGITALITAMAFVNSANDLTIVGDNNVCYAKVVRRVIRNVVIQKKPQLADNAQSTPKFDTSYTETEPNHTETCDIPDSETVRVDKTTDNKNLKKNQDLSLVTVPANGVDNRLGDTTVQIEQYMKANPQSGFSVISALTDYDQYGEYLNNNYKTYVFKTNNFNAPITEPITVNGNLIIEEGMYIALQSDSYELTINGNLIIRGNGSIKCCMEKANVTGLNTVQVKGNIIFDGNTHKMSFSEQSYGFAMPANYARSTQKLNFASSGTWYAVNGKSDDYYNLKQVSKTQTKYLTDVPKPEVPSVFDKKGNGDVNGDGVVNDADVELLRKYLTDIVGESAINKKNADLNADGKVTLTDLSQLKTMIEESKVKSPLIELTDAEINTKYAQYKKYLIPNVKAYYCDSSDFFVNGSGVYRSLTVYGNLILDKKINGINKIDINGSLICLKQGGNYGGGNITVNGTLYYNPDRVFLWERGATQTLIALGDVYIISNSTSDILAGEKYRNGLTNLKISRNVADKKEYNIFFSQNAYMQVESIDDLHYRNFAGNIQNTYKDIYIKDNLIWYATKDNYFREDDLDYIVFNIYGKDELEWLTEKDDIERYKGRRKALVALLLQDFASDLEKLPFLKISRNKDYREARVMSDDKKEYFYVKIEPINNNRWKGFYKITEKGLKGEFEISLTSEYIRFKEKLGAALSMPRKSIGKNNGYNGIIRSIFECGYEYNYGSENMESVNYFGIRKRALINKGITYYTYPVIDSMRIASPYKDILYQIWQRPYDYGIKSPEPNPSQDTILSPEDLQAKLEAHKKDLYEIIVNAIGNEYGNKQSTYEMEGLEELKKNIKLTKNVKLDDDIYMAFLEPLKNKISDTIIKKYDSKVGINFVFDISNILYTGLEKVKDRKVTSGGKVYTLKYDMSWSVHGILVASATLYDYKNSEVTKMTLTNLDTEEGAKNLAQYATGLAILNKEVEENAIYEVMKEVFKEITNDRNTASKLTKTLKFGQEITSAMLTDEAAKNFAKDRGEALKELIDKKGQGHIFNTARNCVRGIVEKYVPNGKNIVKAVDQIDKINKTITKYSNIYKTYNSYNSKTSADELKKMELEFNSYSEALSKILSAIR